MLDIIRLTAKGQELTLVDENGKQTCPHKVASDVVNLISCHFDLEGWDYPLIYAIFSNSMSGEKKEVILQDGNCNVAWEVLDRKGSVFVNLVACEIEGEHIVERLTSYKTQIIEVAQNVNVNADNSIPPTPELWEQTVALLQAEIDAKASTEYVDSEIERVEREIPDVSGFATKEELEEVSDRIPTKTSDLENDSNFLVKNNVTWNDLKGE